MEEFIDPLADFDWDAARTAADARIAGLLAHGGELDRAFARELKRQQRDSVGGAQSE